MPQVPNDVQLSIKYECRVSRNLILAQINLVLKQLSNTSKIMNEKIEENCLIQVASRGSFGYKAASRERNEVVGGDEWGLVASLRWTLAG